MVRSCETGLIQVDLTHAGGDDAGDVLLGDADGVEPVGEDQRRLVEQQRLDLAGVLALAAQIERAHVVLDEAVCLDRLEADRRGMVLLAYCYGWSREELAARFDRPVATVKTILRRCLMALKECLGARD